MSQLVAVMNIVLMSAAEGAHISHTRAVDFAPASERLFAGGRNGRRASGRARNGAREFQSDEGERALGGA